VKLAWATPTSATGVANFKIQYCASGACTGIPAVEAQALPAFRCSSKVEGVRVFADGCLVVPDWFHLVRADH